MRRSNGRSCSEHNQSLIQGGLQLKIDCWKNPLLPFGGFTLFLECFPVVFGCQLLQWQMFCKDVLYVNVNIDIICWFKPGSTVSVCCISFQDEC